MLEETLEWLNQSNYDFETAQAMFQTERYVYALFMCHLAIEKFLKAIIIEKTKETPPRTHNLLTLLKITEIALPSEQKEFLATITAMSVNTRYPENLSRAIQEYNQDLVKDYLLNTKEILKCLKEKLTI
ncbi:HEPN domain-containing protein [Hydrogenispora ethanolica]|uniref:HEPN domain-containing protein n=1 Tax=Hydrogenispora ethanolica TaxID=1082276 RepID=A0A4V6NH11_HYDET|nr:HEPN domain-containing protein [Hydrogenispora ethanolica]TCL70757.1 HEPN domain-containing protein [Hydrogenispora ethanolica]